MPEVGVRELKIRASQIIRDVRERRVRYTITYRGRPVGLLMPLEEPRPTDQVLASEPATAVWEKLLRLGKEIGRGWRSSLTSTELLSEMRR